MKTIRLFGIALLTVLLSVSFFACSSSDDEGSDSNNPLVGTWIGAKGESGWTNNHKLVFNKNGTGTWSEWDERKTFEDPFNYTYTSDRVTFDFGDGSPEKWHYSISGNVLYLSGKGSEYPSSDEKVFKLKKQ